MTASKTDTNTDHPDILVRPPKMVAAGLVIALVLDIVWAVNICPLWFQIMIGLPLLAGGLYLMGWARRDFKAHDTPVSTEKPVREVVTDGPYVYTRNPIYIGGAAALFGLAFTIDNLWLMIATGVIMAVIHLHVIVEEEFYLEKKFGEIYLSYKNKTPRWF